MARRRKYPPLKVFLNSRLVGQLNRQTTGAINFRYDTSWLNWEHAFPVSLSLPLREDKYIGAPVIAVFDNLLPDSGAIRRHLAERVGAEGTDAYSLLSAVGRDCVGALEFIPEGSSPGKAGEIEAIPISNEEIEELIKNLGSAPLGLKKNEDFRISIAGAHEKTALLFWNGGWHKPIGTTPTSHIIKPAIGLLPTGIDLSLSVENEFMCLRLMEAFGVPSASAQIQTFGTKKVLIVERFDRRWTRDKRLLRLPQEDMCQALSYPPSLKYEAEGGPGMLSILSLLRGSDQPAKDRLNFLRANIVFWLLGATDGHAKNFSVGLLPGSRFRLTPCYDVLSAQPNVDAGEIRFNQMKMAMAVGDNRHYVINRISPRHFEQTGEKSKLSAKSIEKVLIELKDMAQPAMDKVISSLPKGFPDNVAESIVKGIRSRIKLIYPSISSVFAA
jgi:serine/threonine-protein kinase HipA